MRIKILEFFAKGKAVVSTSVGAEGNLAEKDTHYLQADSETDFADSVVRLFRSEERRAALGDAARAFVERTYSWASIAEQLEKEYRAVIARCGGRVKAG
jgi:polysaccharide biosynthesis protein PslH